MRRFFDFGIEYGADGFGLFSWVHFLYLALGAVLVFFLCRRYKNTAERERTRRRVGITLFTLELLRAFVLAVNGRYTVYTLPLHLCGMAVYLSFFHALRPRPLLGQFLYAFCMPGALFALVFPDWTYYPGWHFLTLMGFLIHTLLVAYTLMQVCSGDIVPRLRDAPKCLALMLALAAPVYVFNRLAGTNYMFLHWPSPGSPLEWFSFLGNPGYILGYFPILAVVWVLLYARRRR